MQEPRVQLNENSDKNVCLIEQLLYSSSYSNLRSLLDSLWARRTSFAAFLPPTRYLNHSGLSRSLICLKILFHFEGA